MSKPEFPESVPGRPSADRYGRPPVPSSRNAAGADAEGMLTATLVGHASEDACDGGKKHKKSSGCGG